MAEVVLEDKIYGVFKVDNPVLVDLLESPSLQRLKGINQLGLPNRYYHTDSYSRFEHSVGVMLLLRHFGALVEEQVAGLTHDVSHFAFSHTYDWVVKGSTTPGNEEDLQDQNHLAFIQNSEIPGVLRKYGYSPVRFAEHKYFPLLEAEIPNLCVDRIDYSLRQLHLELSKRIFRGLQTIGSQIVCRDFETASIFGNEFLQLQQEEWSGYENTTRHHILSTSLRRALELSIINLGDFLTDDESVLAKLEASGDKVIQKSLDFLRQRPLPNLEGGTKAYIKFRYIDPLFIHRFGLYKVSDIDLQFRQRLKDAREANLKGFTVPDILFI